MTDQKNHFHLDNFDGPLDLLLYLIQKNEINIYDIPIVRITAQFLDILSTGSSINLNEASEFYLFASTLLYIKSRILLPTEGDSSLEVEDPRRELVEQLIEYQKIKKLTHKLHASKIDFRIERNTVHSQIPSEQSEIEAMSAMELLLSYKRILSNIMPSRLFSVYEQVSINEKITLIREKVHTGSEIPFYDLITHKQSALEIICSFFAVLELVKSKVIVVFQNSLFSDIIIKGLDPN